MVHTWAVTQSCKHLLLILIPSSVDHDVAYTITTHHTTPPPGLRSIKIFWIEPRYTGHVTSFQESILSMTWQIHRTKAKSYDQLCIPTWGSPSWGRDSVWHHSWPLWWLLPPSTLTVHCCSKWTRRTTHIRETSFKDIRPLKILDLHKWLPPQERNRPEWTHMALITFS